MQNKEAVIHFTKIARDRFQIYDFRDKSNKIANTRDLASYLTNLRGGQALDNSFYSKLISMPNFSTIAISKDALNITKKASATKLEPWKLEKTADGEVFVSAIEDIEEDSMKKCASLNVKHKYVVSITAKDEDQKIRTYASIKRSACVSESCIVITPVNDYVNFDYESEKAPYDVIEEIIGLLANAGLVIDPKQVECCHDFCDCGMDQVGPVVPCENNEFILDCYDQKPIVGQSIESLKSYAEAHNRKHFKIYAYDKVAFDSDAVIKVKAEDNNKSLFTLYLYSDTDNFVESRDFHTFKDAADSFLQIQKEMGERKTDPVFINYMKIKETTDNGEKVLKSWEGADPGNLIPSEAESAAVVETETKEETETSTPAPLPTSEAKKEVEEKVETPEGQKLEDKVEETVKASADINLNKKADEEDQEPSVSQETIQKYKEHGFVEKGSPEYDEFYNAGLTLKQSLFDKNHYYVVELERERKASAKKEDINKEALLITTEDFSDYKPWSGAVDTYNTIRDAGKLDALESYLEELYPEGIDMTQINDILWFDGDQVLEALGIAEEEEEEDIEDTAKDKSADIEKKSKEKINFEKDLMEAGESKGKKDKVNKKQLEMGKKVEKEHTTSPEIAEKITRDHLKEMPDYYTHLKEMEKGVEKKATDTTTHPAVEEVKNLLKTEIDGNLEVTGPVYGKNEYYIKLPENFLDGDVLEKLLIRIEKKYSDFEYEGGDFDDKVWFAIKDENIEKKSETNADPKVVIDKLEKGDLLPGTAERKEGLEKVVNDKEYKEDIKELKDKGAITEKEIKEVKKEDIDKKADNSDLIAVTIKFDTGDVIHTNVNANQTDEQIRDYYKIGKTFNIGYSEETEDILAKVVDVTIDRGIEKKSKVVKQDGKYQAQSEKGKNFGTYDTKQEAEDRVKQMEMFKHMKKKSADKDFAQEFTNMMEEVDEKAQDKKLAHDDISDSIKELEKALSNKEDALNEVKDAADVYMLYGKKGQSYDQFLKEYDVEAEKDTVQIVENYITKNNVLPKNAELDKKADKVLVDKNTNEVIKPGESTEGKELKEVEVEKSTTTTASNAVYNLFMKSAKINVNAQELRLLTAAYNSNLFKKVAYFGPTAFSFADKDATFIIENGTATFHKTADLTEVEIDKSIKEDPKPATKNEAEDFIKELNKELGVK